MIRLSFADGVMDSRQALDERIRDQLHVERERLQVAQHRNTDIPGEFSALSRGAHAKYAQRVVILIDEYDKPSLDNLLEPERASR